MIAIDIPMPDSCSGCLFRDGIYECMLDRTVRPINFARAPNCPLQRVEYIRARLIAKNDDKSRIEIGKMIGEGLAKQGVIKFRAGMQRVTFHPESGLMQYTLPELAGEMPVILPKGV